MDKRFYSHFLNYLDEEYARDYSKDYTALHLSRPGERSDRLDGPRRRSPRRRRVRHLLYGDIEINNILSLAWKPCIHQHTA